jgi:hypothetical protein
MPTPDAGGPLSSKIRTKEKDRDEDVASRSPVLRGPTPDPAPGNLFLAIELLQNGMTDLPSIAVACRLPLDTVEEIAAAHAVNISQGEQQPTDASDVGIGQSDKCRGFRPELPVLRAWALRLRAGITSRKRIRASAGRRAVSRCRSLPRSLDAGERRDI